MFIAAIEVEFEPHWTDEWLVWATIASFAVSLFIALIALWNARKAGELAAASEAARRNEQDEAKKERLSMAARQEDFQLNLRINDAISEFFTSVSRYLTEMWAWKHEADWEEALAGSVDPDSVRLTSMPSPVAVSTSLEAVMLSARNQIPIFEELRGAVEYVIKARTGTRLSRLPEFIPAIREFRSGSITEEEFRIKISAIVEAARLTEEIFDRARTRKS